MKHAKDLSVTRIRLILLAVVAGLGLASCSPVSKQQVRKFLVQSETRFNDHIGFVLYDPVRAKVLLDYQGDQYFTPASNTKIFTLYASLNVLGDSIPAITYQIRNDTLIFWPTGDPSFLFRGFQGNDNMFQFLKGFEGPIVYSHSNDFVQRFGPGWSWEDYQSTFSVERNAFPIYGNRVLFERKRGMTRTIPSAFEGSVVWESDSLHETERSWNENFFRIRTRTDTALHQVEIPFTGTNELVAQLLADTLKREVFMSTQQPKGAKQKLYSVHADTLYKVMMQESDNFVAEQLLLLCSSELSDSLDTGIALRYLDSLVTQLPDKPLIRDGSGLSRYNLITPRAAVSLWVLISKRMDRERLLHILPAGGISGTLKNGYKAEKPYIYGKTGTLSGVHCLSGFIFTNSGRMLVFSFMNTNYTTSTREVRSNMEVLLRTIRDNY